MNRNTLWRMALPAAVAATCALHVPRQGDPRAEIFVTRGCTQCHAVSDLGVRGRTDAGPDLSFAAEEVPIRYGLSLRQFLGEPAGIMRMVLASHVRLDARDRDSVAVLLERLDAERRGRPPRVVILSR